MYTCIQFLRHKYDVVETRDHYFLKNKETREIVHKFTKGLIRINITDDYIEIY